MSRISTFKPLGLITKPNKHGQYPPGAMSVCKNMVAREPGILRSMPACQQLTAQAITASQSVNALFPLASGYTILVAGTTGMRHIPSGGAGADVTYPTGFPSSTFTFTGGKARFAQMRGRTLVTSDQGVVAFDDDVSFTAPRAAGLQAPILFTNGGAPTGAASLATGYNRNYRACTVRKIGTYTLTSEPSTSFNISNTSGATTDPSMRVYWFDAGIVEGDVVELYRTKDVANGTEPGDTMYLAATATVGAVAAAAGYIDPVIDRSVDATLGEELYTNPGQEGLTQANTPPPYAVDVAVHINQAVYVSRKLIASKRFRISGKYGPVLSSTQDRLYGIGTRAFTGDVTNGSPTILNVSNTNGIVQGQTIIVAAQATRRILSIVGTTITMDGNSTATTVGVAITCADVIEYGAGASDYHGIIGGNNPELYVSSGEPYYFRSTPLQYVINSALPDTVDGPAFEIRSQRYCNGTFTVRATNGANYIPELPDIAETAIAADVDERKNRVHFSKIDKPESVPLLNYFWVGAGEIHRVIPTQGATYAFCSDGLFRITGGGPSAADWAVEQVDRTLVLADRNAVDVLEEVIYAYTNRGMVAISGGVVQMVANDRFDWAGVAIDDNHAGSYFVACDPVHREVWWSQYNSTTLQTVILNLDTGILVTFTDGSAATNFVALAFSRGYNSIIFAESGTSNPDIRYFVVDTSTTRAASAEVRLQPLTMGDPFAQKEYIDVEWMFEGVGSALTLVPSFGGTNYTATTVAIDAVESRETVAVPRNAPAIATRLTPGFTLSAGGTAQNWSLRGVAVRYEYASEENDTR